MNCKPLIVGLNVVGNEVKYPTTSTTSSCSPDILTTFIEDGFTAFRVLFCWERIQPGLAPLLSSTIPSSAIIALDSNYTALLQQFATICQENKVFCTLQLVNGGWYDALYNSNYSNDSTSSCPEAGYVYIDQESTSINGSNYIGPTTQQFVNLWEQIASLEGINQNPYVNFGIGSDPTLDDSIWTTICNKVISNLRLTGNDNKCYVDLMNSSYENLSDYQMFTDSNIVIDIVHYDDNSNGEGPSVVSSDDYVSNAISTNALWGNINSSGSPKLSYSDVRFDDGTLALDALPKFLGYLQANIDTFESVFLYGIGGGIDLPSCYNLNQITNNGVTQDVEQITIAKGYSTKNDISGLYSAISVNLDTSPLTFSQGSPFGNSNECLSSGQLFLPSSPFLSGVKSLTIECWFQNSGISQITTEGYLFGCDGMLGVKISPTYITFCFGNDSNVQIQTNNTITDYGWHHFELGFDSTGVYAFIDGVLQGASYLTLDFDYDPEYGDYMGIRSNGKVIGSTNISIPGNISNFVIWNTLKHNSSFTPPTNYYSGMESGLISNFPLNGDILCWI